MEIRLLSSESLDAAEKDGEKFQISAVARKLERLTETDDLQSELRLRIGYLFRIHGTSPLKDGVRMPERGLPQSICTLIITIFFQRPNKADIFNAGGILSGFFNDPVIGSHNSGSRQQRLGLRHRLRIFQIEERHPRIIVGTDTRSAARAVENRHRGKIQKFSFQVGPKRLESPFEFRGRPALHFQSENAPHGKTFPGGIGVMKRLVAEHASGCPVVNQTGSVQMASRAVILLFFRNKRRTSLQNGLRILQHIDTDPGGALPRSETDGPLSGRGETALPVRRAPVFPIADRSHPVGMNPQSFPGIRRFQNAAHHLSGQDGQRIRTHKDALPALRQELPVRTQGPERPEKTERQSFPGFQDPILRMKKEFSAVMGTVPCS